MLSTGACNEEDEPVETILTLQTLEFATGHRFADNSRDRERPSLVASAPVYLDGEAKGSRGYL